MNIQTTGYIIVKDIKYLILTRTSRFARSLKLRKSGKDGTHFIDEEIHLADNPYLLSQLKDGQVIRV